MAETFVVGDVVQLNSGGERMTVKEIDGDDIACTWFVNKNIQNATFVAGTLKKYVAVVGVRLTR